MGLKARFVLGDRGIAIPTSEAIYQSAIQGRKEGHRPAKAMKNEGSSGDVDEKKEEQVSGVKGQVRGLSFTGYPANVTGAGWRKYSKMKVHPGMLMKRKKSRYQVSRARCQG
ncbi:MAG: hypothetical protein ACLQVG_22140 [Terriglobia bacterium]